MRYTKTPQETFHDVTTEIFERIYGTLQKDVLPETNTTGRLDDCTALNQRDRRNLIRSIFAFFEGVSYWLKVVAAASADAGGFGTLTEDEAALCIESDQKSLTLTDKGELSVRIDTPKLRTLPNVRFAFRIFAKAHNIPFALDAGSRGWQAITETNKVRDRLMHPRDPNKLNVDNDEIKTAAEAFNWFHEQANKMLHDGAEAIKKKPVRTT